MFRRNRIRKCLVGGIAAAALVAPGAALAGNSALVAQSQALNARYGNAVTRLSSKDFNALWNAGGSKLSPQALNALVTRSEALNAASQGSVSSDPYAALFAQSQALNARYGNAVTALTPSQFIALWNAGGSKMSPQSLNELVTRSQAMNAAAYSSGQGITVTGNGFQWGDFGLGAAVAAVAMILLALSMRFVPRSREQQTPIASR